MLSNQTVELHERFKESIKNDLIEHTKERVIEFQPLFETPIKKVSFQIVSDEDGEYCEISLFDEEDNKIHDDPYSDSWDGIRNWSNEVNYAVDKLELKYLEIYIDEKEEIVCQ